MHNLTPYLIHFWTKSGHHHWIRFNPNLHSATVSAENALDREYPEGYELQKVHPCDDPSATYPTRTELAQAGIATVGIYRGPMDFELATALACDLRDTGHFNTIEIVRQPAAAGTGYNIAEIVEV